MPDDDRHLIEQARTDRQAIARLYHLYVDRVYQFAGRQTGDTLPAEDITAVTFEKALCYLHRYDWQGKRVLAWLYRIARNETISR